MTGHAEFNETFFTDVRVPMHHIVGQRGQGWFVANATLGHERGMLGDPDALENRLQALIALMQEQRLGEGRAIDNPVLRDRLVALQAEVAAMKYNGMRILSNKLKIGRAQSELQSLMRTSYAVLCLTKNTNYKPTN